MASIVARLSAWSRSPQGQKTIQTARTKVTEAAQDPRNRARLQQASRAVSQRLRGRSR